MPQFVYGKRSNPLRSRFGVKTAVSDEMFRAGREDDPSSTNFIGGVDQSGRKHRRDQRVSSGFDARASPR